MLKGKKNEKKNEKIWKSTITGIFGSSGSGLLVLLLLRFKSSWIASKRKERNSCASCWSSPANCGANCSITLYFDWLRHNFQKKKTKSTLNLVGDIEPPRSFHNPCINSA